MSAGKNGERREEEKCGFLDWFFFQMVQYAFLWRFQRGTLHVILPDGTKKTYFFLLNDAAFFFVNYASIA